MKVIVGSVVLALVVSLVGCGKSHEVTYAKDTTAEAQAQAIANAPKAEEIVFEDHGASLFPGTVTKDKAEPTQTTPNTDEAQASSDTKDNQDKDTADATKLEQEQAEPVEGETKSQ